MGVRHERPHDVAVARQRPGAAGWLWRIALLALLLHLLAVSLLACVGRLELVRVERGVVLGRSVEAAAAFHTPTVTAPDEVGPVSGPRADSLEDDDVAVDGGSTVIGRTRPACSGPDS